MLNQILSSKANVRPRAVRWYLNHAALAVRRASATLLSVVPLIWCGAATDPVEGGAASMARHVVSDVPSFLRAIGSDRSIEMSAGEYLLDPAAVVGQTSPHWQFEEVSDGRQLVIIGVTNLTIRGRGLETPVRVRPRYAAVLSFRWVQGLRLENLHLSHTDETGYCTGAVLQFRVGCRDIHIEQSQLLGSGSYGLCLEGVENLTLTDSVITDCTYGGFSIDQSRMVRIVSCRIEDNQGFHLLTAWNSSDLLFRDCRIQRNRFTESTLSDNTMFWVYRVTGVRVERCVFGPSQADYLVSDLGPVLFEDCEFAENTWRRGKYKPYQPPPPAGHWGN